MSNRNAELVHLVNVMRPVRSIRNIYPEPMQAFVLPNGIRQLDGNGSWQIGATCVARANWKQIKALATGSALPGTCYEYGQVQRYTTGWVA